MVALKHSRTRIRIQQNQCSLHRFHVVSELWYFSKKRWDGSAEPPRSKESLPHYPGTLKNITQLPAWKRILTSTNINRTNFVLRIWICFGFQQLLGCRDMSPRHSPHEGRLLVEGASIRLDVIQCFANKGSIPKPQPMAGEKTLELGEQKRKLPVKQQKQRVYNPLPCLSEVIGTNKKPTSLYDFGISIYHDYIKNIKVHRGMKNMRFDARLLDTHCH